MKIKSIIISAVFIMLASACAPKGNPEYDAALNSLEKIIVEYENFVKKEQFCMSDSLKLIQEVTPQMTAMNQKLEQFNASKEEPSADQKARYMALAQRMSAALQALSTKQPAGC